MNSNRNGWDTTEQAKMPYFHCGPSIKLKNIKREIEKNKDIFKV